MSISATLRITCMILLLLPGIAFSQSPPIKGRVTDTNGNPIPGASIAVKGKSLGTATRPDGSFTLLVSNPEGQVLVISSIGFAEKEITMNSGTSYNVQLETSEQALSTIVVVGYGTQKKRDVTGAVASIPKERLQQLPNTNVAEALQGSVPGLQINTNSGGAEGNNLSILVRGRNSISASTSPLIIWDGIPYVGGISEINPNDVESIEVLKDASAAAIYGSRGSNGVILITSKQGRKGKVDVTYDGFYSTQTLINKPRLLTGPEFYEFKTTRLNSNTNVLSPQEQEVYDAGGWVDWYDLATQQGSKMQHSLSVRGGTDKVTYYVGGTYLDVKGVARNDRFKRYTIRPTLDIKVTPWLTLATSSQLSFQDRSGLPVEFDDSRNAGGGANFFNPLTAPYNEDGSIAVYAYLDNKQARNPLGNILVKNQDNSYRIFSTNSIKVDVPFIKGLSYKLNTGIEFESILRKTYYGRDVAIGLEQNGNAINYNSISRNFTVENILNYSREFGVHSVNVTALYSSQSEDFDRDQLEGVDFPNDVLTNYQMNLASLLTPSSTNFKQNLLSQMARINYGYDGRYLLTLTARRDGYSAFGDGKKFGVFPSAAVAWNISEESFMKPVTAVSNLKLRASYGLNGNQAVSSYSSLATMSSAPYISGITLYPGYVPNKLSNDRLGWESTRSFSLGLDFGLLRNRIQGTIDLYSANTEDLLLLRSISSVQGITEVLQNIGKTANKGIEVGITSTNIKSRNLTWTTTLNFSSNKNRIVDLYGDGLDDLLNGWFIGKPIRTIYALQYDGIFRTAEEVAASPQPTAEPGWVKVRDVDGDGTINTASDRTFLGQRDPKFIWGLTNTVRYKGFSLMVFFHGIQGALKDNPLQSDNVFADTRRNTMKKDWWSPKNPNGTHFSNDANANKLSITQYENASFTRLKDISLAYELPASITSKLKITSTKAYITARNLATFTKYEGLDPELTNQHGIPLQREIVVGLTIGL